MNGDTTPPLSASASEPMRHARYGQVLEVIDALLSGEDDWVAAQATVVAELHGAFEYFDWTGFYRLVRPELLVIGPYQGVHGCIRIELPRGVCGAAASTRATQLVPDVHDFPGHIACSASTRSEIVVPVIAPSGRLLGVLDVDSNTPSAFSAVDASWLERLCAELGRRYGDVSAL